MRRAALIVSLIAAAGCDGGLPQASARTKRPAWDGPDAVLVRVPIAGGGVRAYRWGRDSVLWSSTQPVPALSTLLAFDADAGTIIYVDKRGVPGRVELRLGTIAPATTTPMSSLASADGWAVYGINPKHEVERLTPSGNWSHPSALTPRLLIPEPDGSLVLLNDIGNRSVLRRLHPPEARITDTASVPKAEYVVPTTLGDRIYFTTDSGLVGVRVRDLARTRTINLGGPIRAAVPTPSGDRIFAALAGRAALTVIDRYDEKITGRVPIEGYPAALRMDPDGRYVIAKLESFDSVAVISVAESRVIRVIHTKWRDDLPLVAPDGALLVLDGNDAVDLDPATGKERRRYTDGGSDFWALLRWNGFRPRAKGLDTPVSFDADSADTTAATDAARKAAAQNAASSAVSMPTPGDAPAPAARDKNAGWTLSFAAMLDEGRAKTLATTIKVDGRAVRVVEGKRDGVSIWRVVYGPFPTRDDAERAGRRTGLPYWVYEDVP